MGCILTTMTAVEEPTQSLKIEEAEPEPFTNLTITIPLDPETKAHESAKRLEKELFGTTPKKLVIETLQKETTIVKSVSFHDLTNVHEYTPLSNESVCSDELEYELSPTSH